MPPKTNSNLAVPIAIILGFALIAVAVYFSGVRLSPTNPADNQPQPAAKTKIVDIKPVAETDYIRGNPNAPILIVEYSDYDCPFCENFHKTMKRIMDEFGVNGQVAWVYRQYPIAQLHPNAPRLSQAALCVGELGGTEAFWTFSDLIFSEREFNAPTNMTRLNEFATKAGVNVTELESCLNSERHTKTVQATLLEGAKAGIVGTPHSVVITGDQKAAINGAQPYEVVRGIVSTLVSQLPQE